MRHSGLKLEKSAISSVGLGGYTRTITLKAKINVFLTLFSPLATSEAAPFDNISKNVDFIH